MSSLPTTDTSILHTAEANLLDDGDKPNARSTGGLNQETVATPTRPPPPSRAPPDQPRPPPPPRRPVRAMTLTGIPKAAEIARTRAKARAGSFAETESQFHSVRHLVSPPPIVEREASFFTFDQQQRGHRARSFSPGSGPDNRNPMAEATKKARQRKSLSPDSSFVKPVDQATTKAGSLPRARPKVDNNRPEVSKESQTKPPSGTTSDDAKTGSEDVPAVTPPKRPRRPYAPPIFEAKVARKRPPPIPHVIDIRDSSPQMSRTGRPPPVSKTTVVDTRSPSESPRRPPLPAALAQSGLKKAVAAGKDDSTQPTDPAPNDSQNPHQTNTPEATPTRRAPVVRFSSPPPASLSSSKSPSPPVIENYLGNRQEDKVRAKHSSLPRNTPAVKFNLEADTRSLDTPTTSTAATPTPPHLNLTESESGPGAVAAAESSSLSVEEDEPVETGGPIASGKSPSPSRSRRFIKSMKSSFRHMKRKRDGERRAVVTIGHKPPSRAPDDDDSSSKQSARAHTVCGGGGGRHDNHHYNKEKYPDELPQGIIDPVIVKAIAYLNKEQVLMEEGLFRIPGDLTVIKSLRARFNNREDVDLNEILDPHTIAGLLKVHFREMRVSIIPRGPILAEIIRAVQSHDVQLFSSTIVNIEPHHLATIRMLAEVLSKIAANSSKNRMTSGTLATSCGPSIFPYLPPSNANAVIKFLIDHCAQIFTE